MKDGDDFIANDDDEDDDENVDDEVHPEFERFSDEDIGECSHDEDADKDQNKEHLQVRIPSDDQSDENPEGDDQCDFL